MCKILTLTKLFLFPELTTKTQKVLPRDTYGLFLVFLTCKSIGSCANWKADFEFPANMREISHN